MNDYRVETLTLAKITTTTSGTTIELVPGSIKALHELDAQEGMEEFSPLQLYRQLGDIRIGENFLEYHRFCEELILKIAKLRGMKL